MAGYSGTPLVRKLGIKEDHVIAISDAPAGFVKLLGKLPPGAEIAKKWAAGGHYDVLIAFCTTRAGVENSIAVMRPMMTPAAGLWIAWPKKSSGVKTDVTENTVRDVALPTGLVDNKVCAIDDTWSGLRLVIRKANR